VTAIDGDGVSVVSRGKTSTRVWQVDTQETVVEQAATATHDFVPYQTQGFFSASAFLSTSTFTPAHTHTSSSFSSSFAPSPSHPGDSKDATFVELLAVSKAMLTAQAFPLRMRANVLMEGARGSGKRLAVRRLAESLNMHLMERSMFDHMTASEGGMADAIRADFERAMLLRPVVLHFRRMDAVSVQTSVSSESDGAQVASALRSCIEVRLLYVYLRARVHTFFIPSAVDISSYTFIH
jgi:hypothetical protein